MSHADPKTRHGLEVYSLVWISYVGISLIKQCTIPVLLHLEIRARDLMTQSKKRVKSLTSKATKAWNRSYWFALLCSYTILWLAALDRYRYGFFFLYQKVKFKHA